MRFAFQQMQLQADSLFALIQTWAEMQLVLTEDSAEIIGFGYSPEISEAFTLLVFDWEATIILPEADLAIPIGSYDLIRQEDMLYACKEQRSYPLADCPVLVRVMSVPED